MQVKFLGAARTVTGSCFLMRTDKGALFAVDCGLHQGNDEIDKRNWNTDEYRPRELEFILVTHAHIDHSGLLPRLVSQGFKGKIYCTPPTKDLLGIMLEDSGHIQEMEAEWKNRKRKRHGFERQDPLYTVDDALKTKPLIEAVAYGESFTPAEGVTVTYRDAGHILGSAFIELDVDEGEGVIKTVFSGDLGRPEQLLVANAEIVERADYLFMESTYGDRDHKDESTSMEELAEAIWYSYANGEKVIIPAFAVERTQEILYSLHLLEKRGKLPEDMPVYVDSPLAIKATEIFRAHTEYLDEETRSMIERGEDPLALKNLKFTRKAHESMAVNEKQGPAVVISASGMCNAGRIKHHLKHNLWREGASVVFVGFQAKGTPGRRIVDGAKKIRVLGEEVAVKAKVFTIGGFSAHAGQSQILEWLSHFRNPEMQVFLVHGETRPLEILSGLIGERLGLMTHIPGYLEECVMAPGPEMAVSREEHRPHIDWELLLKETEAKMDLIRERAKELESKPWVDQADLRDRLLEVNKEMLELVSEM
jgi:metallo-beta-lactamase family protein